MSEFPHLGMVSHEGGTMEHPFERGIAMGYRSDVRFNTNSEGYKRFLSLIPDEYRCEGSWLFRSGEPEVFEEDHDTITFGWNDVKWYEDENFGFPEVRAIMSAFSVASDDHPFEYVRIGEDYDDIDCRNYDDEGELYWHLDVRKEIYKW